MFSMTYEVDVISHHPVESGLRQRKQHCHRYYKRSLTIQLKQDWEREIPGQAGDDGGELIKSSELLIYVDLKFQKHQ